MMETLIQRIDLVHNLKRSGTEGETPNPGSKVNLKTQDRTLAQDTGIGTRSQDARSATSGPTFPACRDGVQLP